MVCSSNNKGASGRKLVSSYGRLKNFVYQIMCTTSNYCCSATRDFNFSLSNIWTITQNFKNQCNNGYHIDMLECCTWFFQFFFFLVFLPNVNDFLLVIKGGRKILVWNGTKITNTERPAFLKQGHKKPCLIC